jgi:hypothetical protein
MVNVNRYNTCNFLSDKIYPDWAVFMKLISLPITDKDKLFVEHQEGKRKDIERAFGSYLWSTKKGRERTLREHLVCFDVGFAF